MNYKNLILAAQALTLLAREERTLLPSEYLFLEQGDQRDTRKEEKISKATQSFISKMDGLARKYGLQVPGNLTIGKGRKSQNLERKEKNYEDEDLLIKIELMKSQSEILVVDKLTLSIQGSSNPEDFILFPIFRKQSSIPKGEVGFAFQVNTYERALKILLEKTAKFLKQLEKESKN